MRRARWNLSKSLIAFQNTAEKEFQEVRNVGTITRYLLAFVLFLVSTLVAFVTIPYRSIRRIGNRSGSERVIAINSENHDDISVREPLLLLDFWAEWCGPCMMMNPVIAEFMNVNDEVTLGKVNADFNRDLLNKYQVKGIPQFILLKDGREIKRNAGPMTLKELTEFVGV